MIRCQRAEAHTLVRYSILSSGWRRRPEVPGPEKPALGSARAEGGPPLASTALWLEEGGAKTHPLGSDGERTETLPEECRGAGGGRWHRAQQSQGPSLRPNLSDLSPSSGCQSSPLELCFEEVSHVLPQDLLHQPPRDGWFGLEVALINS